ncbi:MAG: HAD family hydrolase [Thermoproteus sp.]|nr:HAD family hydrolase [Thermoproteus sp.]
MASAVYAFDCDGTLEFGNPPGPVKIEQLMQMSSRGIVVVIVSDSGNCARLWKENGGPFLHVSGGATSGDQRTNALLAVKRMFQAERYVYVSDNPGDDKRSADAGFEYVYPTMFVPP